MTYLWPAADDVVARRAVNRKSSQMRKSSPKSLPSLSVRIDLSPERRIGPGKIQLLENIGSSGSVAAAGRAMNMSYKRAWDLVDEINRICKRSVVKRCGGRAARAAAAGCSRRSARPAPAGNPLQLLLDEIDAWSRTDRHLPYGIIENQLPAAGGGTK
jgi:hypothetical protein